MNIVKLISDRLNSSIENEGSASLVVSGGSSPIRIYEELSNIDISWSRVFLTLVDDRFVDPDHKDSNQKLLYNHFIKNKAKDIKFFPLTKNFLKKTNFKKPFDITLLGMGEDGHFASLFPDMINDNDAFDLNESPKILITPPQGNPYLPRITMNLSLIMKSINIVLLIKGKAKQDIFNKAKKDEDLPIHYLIKNRNKNFFVEKIDE
jgi:6-phosphogluconolactonase|tara:strand:- start:478 stop:1095 length:618 start_codon:yes stop_codon:yes gene_type:complete